MYRTFSAHTHAEHQLYMYSELTLRKRAHTSSKYTQHEQNDRTERSHTHTHHAIHSGDRTLNSKLTLRI